MQYLAISGEDFSTYLHVLVCDKSWFVQWQISKSVCSRSGSPCDDKLSQ